MNNKGVTLVELISVIVLLGVIALLIVPSIIIFRKTVLQNTYNSKVTLIENAAKDYAQDHIEELKSSVSENYDGVSKGPSSDCIYRTVSYLINNGYLSVSNSYNQNDNERSNQMLNPITNESMNTMRVCIRFDTNNAMTREVVTYLVKEDES